MSRRATSGLLLALALALACQDAAKPATPAILVSGGPLATAETGTRAGFEVRLAMAPAAAVDVEVRSEDPTEGLLLAPGAAVPAALVALRFTPADWNVAQVVTVVGVDDAVKDGDVSYRVRLSVAASADAGYAAAADATVTVVNHDDDLPAILLSRTQLHTAESGNRYDAFEVVLTTQPSSTVTLAVVSGRPAEELLRGGTDPLTASASIRLVFTPSNWGVPQVVTVVGQPDHVVDGAQASMVTVGPATGDPAYAALSTQQVTVVNADTDVPAVLVTGGPAVVAEWSTTSFQVRLATIPAAPVTIPVTSGDTTEALVAGPGDPALLPSAALHFDADNWDQPQSVTVQGQADWVVDGPQRFEITVGPASGDVTYAALPAALVDTTVTDSDVPGFQWANFAIVTSEGGRTSTVQLALSAAPLADVTVPVASSDPAEALVSAGGAPPSPSLTLTFTPADWSTWREITVSGVDDALFEPGPPHPYSILVGPTRSSSALYDGLAGPTLAGTNADDEVGTNQGSAAAPIEVTGLLPFSGQVGTGSSFYRLTGFPDGGWIGVGGNREAVAVTAWSDEAVPTLLCRGPAPYFAQPSCAARTPPGGAVVLEVSGLTTARGDTYTVFANPFVLSADPPQAIPDDSSATVVSTVTLAGLTGPPGELAILLEAVHPAVNELSVQLTPPGGGGYQFTYTPGGGADFDSTVLAPSGEQYIGVGSAPYAGVFRPAVTLPGGFDGTWTLTVRDQVPGNAGLLVRWGIAVR